MLQTRTRHMHHSEIHATKVAPIDKPCPNRDQTRIHPRVHTDQKSRRRGDPPAPASTPRHNSAGSQGIRGGMLVSGGRAVVSGTQYGWPEVPAERRILSEAASERFRHRQRAVKGDLSRKYKGHRLSRDIITLTLVCNHCCVGPSPPQGL